MIPIAGPPSYLTTPFRTSSLIEWTGQYFQGAVEFGPSSAITGASATNSTVVTNFKYGVMSYWINFGAITAESCITHIYQPGPNSASFAFDPSSMQTMNAYIFQDNNPAVTDFPIGLNLIDGNSSNTLINAWVFVPGNPTPSGWHHCIWSWDASQTNIVPPGSSVSDLPVLRVQFAYDRGGTPADGGGVYDTLLGCNGLPSGGIVQPMTSVSGTSSFSGNTGVTTAYGVGHEWLIATDANTTMNYAYCYMGYSDAFFDLTFEHPVTDVANLDQFITPGLIPVNLGFRGAAPINVETGNPLTCLFAHTGNATSQFNINPLPWNPFTAYFPKAPGELYGSFVTQNGIVYQAIKQSGTDIGVSAGATGSLPVSPQFDTQMQYWIPLIGSPFAGYQFQFNNADGTLWPLVGSIHTAPSQPNTGA